MLLLLRRLYEPMVICGMMMVLFFGNAVLCLSSCSEGGMYLPTSGMPCIACPSGSFCPEGSDDMQLCLPGSYQPLQKQSLCLPCMENHECPRPGMTSPVPCPEGVTAPLGSSACGNCDFAYYYRVPWPSSTSGFKCVPKTPCNFQSEYEVNVTLQAYQSQNTQCKPLHKCNTERLSPTSIINGLTSPYVATITPRSQYIVKYNTRYSDMQCWSWAPCQGDEYAAQMPIDDGLGFLVQHLICKKLTQSNSLKRQYKLVDGERTRDRDNVWNDCSVCNPDTQVRVASCTDISDTVCAPRTKCNARYEYVLNKGDWEHDTICAKRTQCTRDTQRGMYELMPSVDSTNYAVNGTDAVCANYSSCADGYWPAFVGDDTHDVRCDKCPEGTYRNASDPLTVTTCRPCPEGTFAAAPGSVSCTPCRSCDDSGNDNTLFMVVPDAQKGWCPWTDAYKHCVWATLKACTSTSDAECVACPTLSSAGGYALVEENKKKITMCVPCKEGYYYNKSEPLEGLRCIPCPAGFYCPYKDEIHECQGLQIFRENNNQQFTIVPMTVPTVGASRPTHCSCSLAGGFEASSVSQGLFGCTPCAEGFYAPPNAKQGGSCMPCPMGTFAVSQKLTSTLDYRKCPSAELIALLNNNSAFKLLAQRLEEDLLKGASSSLWCSSQSPPLLQQAVAVVAPGAVACTACPSLRPYTWAEQNKSISDCRRCPKGFYFDESIGCKRCSAECGPAPHIFEVSPCTEDSDRVCAECDTDPASCNAITEYPLPDCITYLAAAQHTRRALLFSNNYRACAPCTNKPLNSMWVRPTEGALGATCTWKCLPGFYSELGVDECKPCRVLTPQECKPGYIYKPCSDYLHEDASCDEPCDAEAYGKPSGDETNEWVWTTLGGADGMTLVQQQNAGLTHNVGCMWKCKEGYTLRALNLGEADDVISTRISFCVPKYD